MELLVLTAIRSAFVRVQTRFFSPPDLFVSVRSRNSKLTMSLPNNFPNFPTSLSSQRNSYHSTSYISSCSVAPRYHFSFCIGCHCWPLYPLDLRTTPADGMFASLLGNIADVISSPYYALVSVPQSIQYDPITSSLWPMDFRYLPVRNESFVFIDSHDPHWRVWVHSALPQPQQ